MAIPELASLRHFGERTVSILLAMVALHLAVTFVRWTSGRIVQRFAPRSLSKTRTLVSLVTSFAIFALWFVAIGFVAREAGISLKAYLASASIVGLAIGFGSQGLVQDVVTGITLVFSDLLDVGDMVEIGGQTGVVRSVGMRFTVIENPLGALVYVPNRSIGNVVNYPSGYVRAIADITLGDDPETRKRMVEIVEGMVSSSTEQFAGILVAAPSIEGEIVTTTGRRILRVKFRIWPGRGAPLETAFRQEAIAKLRAVDPSYADWMIVVNYEVEEKRSRIGRR